MLRHHQIQPQPSAIDLRLCQRNRRLAVRFRHRGERCIGCATTVGSFRLCFSNASYIRLIVPASFGSPLKAGIGLESVRCTAQRR